MKYTFHIVDVFQFRHRSAVINSRFCLTRPAFRPRACRRLLANSISAKPPSSCQRTILRTRVGCAIFTPRAELDFAGHPTVGNSLCACDENSTNGLVNQSASFWRRMSDR